MHGIFSWYLPYRYCSSITETETFMYSGMHTYTWGRLILLSELINFQPGFFLGLLFFKEHNGYITGRAFLHGQQ